MKKILITLALMFVSCSLTFAQCAMCQGVVSSNLSDGRGSVIGLGINSGVLLLLAMPYTLIASLIFFWYRNAKKNLAKKLELQQRLREVLG